MVRGDHDKLAVRTAGSDISLWHVNTFTLLHVYTFVLFLIKEWKYCRSTCLIPTHWDFSSLRQHSQIQPGNSAYTWYATHHRQVLQGAAPIIVAIPLHWGNFIPRNNCFRIRCPSTTLFATIPTDAPIYRVEANLCLYITDISPAFVNCQAFSKRLLYIHTIHIELTDAKVAGLRPKLVPPWGLDPWPCLNRVVVSWVGTDYVKLVYVLVLLTLDGGSNRLNVVFNSLFFSNIWVLQVLDAIVELGLVRC